MMTVVICHQMVLELEGHMPYEHVFTSTPNISAMAMFDLYQPLYYFMPQADFPFEKKLIR